MVCVCINTFVIHKGRAPALYESGKQYNYELVDAAFEEIIYKVYCEDAFMWFHKAGFDTSFASIEDYRDQKIDILLI
jgi:hypothetical protein